MIDQQRCFGVPLEPLEIEWVEMRHTLVIDVPALASLPPDGLLASRALFLDESTNNILPRMDGDLLLGDVSDVAKDCIGLHFGGQDWHELIDRVRRPPSMKKLGIFGTDIPMYETGPSAQTSSNVHPPSPIMRIGLT